MPYHDLSRYYCTIIIESDSFEPITIDMVSSIVLHLELDENREYQLVDLDYAFPHNLNILATSDKIALKKLA